MQSLPERVRHAADLIAEVNGMASETVERMRAAHVPEELIVSQCRSMYGVDVLPPTITPPPTADLVALVREIASDDDPTYEVGGDWDHSGVAHCRYCDARIWGGEKHRADCVWVRARALVTRLDAVPQQSGALILQPVSTQPVYVTINGMRREVKPAVMTLEEAEAAGLITFVRPPPE